MSFAKKIIFVVFSSVIIYLAFWLIFPDDMVSEYMNFWSVLIDLITISICVMLTWYFNNKFICWADTKYMWENKPIKRLLLQITGTTIIASFVLLFMMIPNVFITVLMFPKLLIDYTLAETVVLYQRIVYFFCAVLIIFNAIHISLNFYNKWIVSATESQRLKYEHLSAHLQVLQNQIQPHFLFNTLNTLTSLIQDDKKIAIEFVENLATFYRYSLQKQENHLVKLDEELSFVNTYMYLQKKRFGDNLNYSIEIPAELKNRYLPSNVLLILFENAIKHNVVSKEKPLYIKLHSISESLLIVENNLQKKKSIVPSTGYGLNNVRYRYNIICKKDIQITEDDKNFIVILPLLEGKNEYESINN